MNIAEALTSFNLTPREAQLYLALLELGQATPLALAHKTGFKRPTVYLDLESLRRKKLAGLSFKGKKSVYVPESPMSLVKSFRERQEILENVIPYLRALERKSGIKPQVRYYDREEEIKRAYFEEAYRAPENMYITNIQKLHERMPELLEVYEERIRQGIIKRSREIISASPFDLAYASKHHQKNRQIRIIPTGLSLELDISLWNDNVGLYSIIHHYMLVISDVAIAKTFRGLFGVLWSVSRGTKDLKKF